MLFAVIVGHAPDNAAGAGWWADERQKFLEALRRSGRLILEGTYGENGSLMFIDAASTNDALAYLHNDPYVLASSRVQIRPLSVNFVGPLDGATSGPRPATKLRRKTR